MTASRPERVAAVVLAAGASTRFGSGKQRALVDGRPMLDAVIDVARRAGLTPILVVVPPGLPVPPDVVPVVNDLPEEGLSRSLRLGVGALPPEAPAAVILLGDQPTLDPEVIRRLVAARGERSIVATEARGILAPPVLLERDALPLVQELSGDEGLRRILRAGSDEVATVQVADHPPDVDRPEDLERL
jgi:CTP:molybdopterin cytidylyltransferase MocA